MTSCAIESGLCQSRCHQSPSVVVRHTIDRLARRLFGVEVNRLLWLEVERLAASTACDRVVEFRFLGLDEVGQLAADPDNHLGAAMADPATSGGGLCLAALVGRRLAAYGWFAVGEVDPRHCGGVRLSLPMDVAYFYNGFTHPDFRGRRLYGQLTSWGLRALADRGVHRLVASVAWTNAPALASARRLGYVDLGCFLGIGRGRWRLVFPPRAARRRGIGVRVCRG